MRALGLWLWPVVVTGSVLLTTLTLGARYLIYKQFNALPTAPGRGEKITGNLRLVSMHSDDFMAGAPGAPPVTDPPRRRPILMLDRKLGRNGPTERIVCYFEQNAGDWYGNIDIGREVTLRGVVTSRKWAGPGEVMVIVEDCEYISHER